MGWTSDGKKIWEYIGVLQFSVAQVQGVGSGSNDLIGRGGRHGVERQSYWLTGKLGIPGIGADITLPAGKIAADSGKKPAVLGPLRYLSVRVLAVKGFKGQCERIAPGQRQDCGLGSTERFPRKELKQEAL
jgi:hypothetical protein